MNLLKTSFKVATDIVAGLLLGIGAILAIAVAGVTSSVLIAVAGILVAALVLLITATGAIAIGGAFVVGYPISSGRILKNSLLEFNKQRNVNRKLAKSVDPELVEHSRFN